MLKAIGAQIDKLLAPRGKHRGVLAVYYYVDDVTAVINALKQSGHRDVAV